MNYSESGRPEIDYNYNYLYIGYPLPFVPMSVIITYSLGGSLGDQSLPAAWAALILSLPAYYFLYIYLDQVVPNTFGISKSCCFCFKKRRTGADDIRNTFKNSKIQDLDESRSKLDGDQNMTEDNEVPFLTNNNVRLFK